MNTIKPDPAYLSPTDPDHLRRQVVDQITEIAGLKDDVAMLAESLLKMHAVEVGNLLEIARLRRVNAELRAHAVTTDPTTPEPPPDDRDYVTAPLEMLRRVYDAILKADHDLEEIPDGVYHLMEDARHTLDAHEPHAKGGVS